VQCFRYYRLRRLSDAWTPGTGSWDETAGCAGDPTADGLAGPAPYWHSYTYDTTGNRLTETQHDPTGDVARTYVYPAPAQPQPHTLTAVTTDTPQGTNLDTYGYDPAGNTASRSLAGEDEVLRWDAEGHLASVTKDGQSTSFIYDTNGQRLLRRDPTSVTLYLGKQELKLDRATNTVSATRYYTAGGDGPTIGVRQGATLTWLASDHQATNEVAVKSATPEATRRRQYPFGAPRDEQPQQWPGDRGFLSGTRDATGLTHLGAREYDPTLGRFLSVDPIVDLADPQQMNGYTYSNNNPVTFSDPTGMWMSEDDSGFIDSGACRDNNCGKSAAALQGDQGGTPAQQAEAELNSPVLGKKLDSNALGALRTRGYKGSAMFSVREAFEFAAQGDDQWEIVCQAMGGAADECMSYNPFTGERTRNGKFNDDLEIVEFIGFAAIAVAACAAAPAACLYGAVAEGLCDFCGAGGPVRARPAELSDADATSIATATARSEAATTKAAGGTYPTMTSAAVDRTTGKVYPGPSGNPNLQVPDEVANVLPAESMEPWVVRNCAEVAACSAAVRDGAKLEHLTVVTVRTRNGMIVPPCRNCSTWVPGGK